VKTETLPDGHVWLRIADAGWDDPLDSRFAQKCGGRWNQPGTFPVLYLSEDLVTARFNLERFIEGWPYEPEDLRDDTGPVLVHATLPRRQRVADCHTPEGVTAMGLPPTYPLDSRGGVIPHRVCQPIGQEVRNQNLRGVRARSSCAPQGSGRELAWFPAGSSSRARMTKKVAFSDWFWG